MKSDQMIVLFSEVLNQKPELFQGEVLKDLTRLEISLDETEKESELDRIESVMDAVIDFCEVNPEIYEKLQEMGSELKLNQVDNSGQNSIERLTTSVNKILDLNFLNREEL